jgi:hypothetical protein
MSKRSLFLVAFILVLGMAFLGLEKLYAQGPGGNNNSPCGGRGYGMMMGQQEDCPFYGEMHQGRGMMGGGMMMGHHGMMQGGMMGGRGMMYGFNANEAEVTVTPEQAQEAAQAYLEENEPELTLGEDAGSFNGHYMFEVLQEGEYAGMVHVNGFTGDVWFHDCPFATTQTQ